MVKAICRFIRHFRQIFERFSSNPKYYDLMKLVGQIFVVNHRPEFLISGGAAFADHLAVDLFLSGDSLGLKLYIPAEFKGGKYVVENPNAFFCPAKTSNHYHRKFSELYKKDSLMEIQQAITIGAKIFVGKSFKDRNTEVANESNILLAFTFGNGPALKDGGTKDTMDKFLKRKAENSALRAFHFDLNSKKLFELSS